MVEQNSPELPEVGVVMLHVSGRSKDSQWFDFRPGVLAAITRVEWELGTMNILIPSDIAALLVRQGHARPMTSKELEESSESSSKEEATKEKGE